MKLVQKYPFSLLLIVAMIALSLLPLNERVAPIPSFEGMDKCVHLVMYLSFSLSFVYELRKDRKKNPIIIGGLAGLLLGGTIELVQHFLISYRSGDWMDMGANLIGTVCAMVVSFFWKRSKH